MLREVENSDSLLEMALREFVEDDVEEDDAEARRTIHRSPTEQLCVTCHNEHHSPRFDFATYRAKLIVPGHGKPAE